MYNILFNCDEKHIKYVAVSCYSIIINTKSQKHRDPYIFHIFTDGITEATRNKLAEFEVKLNEIYPCKFTIYTLSDNDFRDFPHLRNSFLSYFCLKLGTVLPSNVDRCLLLGADTICFSDIRELFSIDLKHNVCAAPLNGLYMDQDFLTMHSKDPMKQGIKLNVSNYYNDNSMLIDLQKWRKQDIESKCMEFLRNYIPKFNEQDAINVALIGKIMEIPLKWNFLVVFYEIAESGEKCFMDEVSDNILYTRKQYMEAKQDIKILHFAGEYKPWKIIDKCPLIYKNCWWNMAFNTPIFNYDLKMEYMNNVDNSLKHLFLRIDEMQKQIRLLRRPHKMIIMLIKKILKLK